MEVVLERPVAVVQGRIIRVRIKDASLRISNLLVWLSPSRRTRTRSAEREIVRSHL